MMDLFVIACGLWIVFNLMGISASLRRLADHHEKFAAPEASQNACSCSTDSKPL